jgi:hypothetical protein
METVHVLVVGVIIVNHIRYVCFSEVKLNEISHVLVIKFSENHLGFAPVDLPVWESANALELEAAGSELTLFNPLFERVLLIIPTKQSVRLAFIIHA